MYGGSVRMKSTLAEGSWRITSTQSPRTMASIGIGCDWIGTILFWFISYSVSAPFSRGTRSEAMRGALLPRQGLHFGEGDPNLFRGRSPEKAEARRPQG